MTTLKVLILSFSALFLVSCHIETPDGKVPAEHIQTAKKYLGTYEGDIEQLDGTAAIAQIKISLDSENRVILNYADTQEGDILGGDCNSQVGKLKSVRASEEKLKNATFHLSPGNCSDIPGRELSLRFKTRNGVPSSFSTSIHYKTDRIYRCHTTCTNSGDCHRRCGHERVPRYLRGMFNKEK